MKRLLLLLLLLAPVATLAAAAHSSVTEQAHGTSPEGPVSLYTLKNAHGLSVDIMNFGATVVSVRVPDKDGKIEDVALGFDTPQAYIDAKLNFGTMGRYINRIGGGKITLDGTNYSLTQNNGQNTMHGGKLGFNRHLWQVVKTGSSPAMIEMSRLSPDGEEGFPGNLKVSVTFTLTNSNTFTVHYDATTDKPTVVNLSNHTLFNLSVPGNDSILHDIVTVDGSAVTPIDATSVPTGEIKSVDGTPYDLRKATLISDRVNTLGVTPPGYDINYVLDKGGKKGLVQAGEIYDPKSGRDLRILTDQPGAQFYTGNLFDGSLIGKGGVHYTQYVGLSLEAQHFPDSPHHDNFPSTELKPGDTYKANIEYIFSVKK
jgi:aldose 1-epimerase